MTKQEIYEQIVSLTSELHATNVAEKIFGAAKEGDDKKVEEVFKTFKEENPDLYARIVSFGEIYNELVHVNFFNGQIFIDTENKEDGKYVFDTNQIDAMSFFVFICLADVDDYYFFDLRSKSRKNFEKAFKEAGYKEMYEFVYIFFWKDCVGEGREQYPTVSKLLVAIFKCEFKDGE